MAFDVKQLKQFPSSPGVYIMKSQSGQVLYIGKAKNLRQRVRQYFSKSGDGRFMVPFLVSKVASIDTVVVNSEKEALLLENNLIKQHKPKYNALLKDDKSYIALKLTKHQWPRIDLVRYRGKPKADGQYFGPYTHTGSARKTLDLLHKLFPLRQCSDQEFAKRTRPCILYDIKRCVAPCVNMCSSQEYVDLVGRTVKFLKGQDKEIINQLYEQMGAYADNLEFEKAAEIHQTITHLEKTVEGQSVDRPLGVDADVIGLYREGDEVVLAVLFFRGGRLTGSRHYNFRSIAQDDQELLHAFLLQRYHSLQEVPHEILLPIQVNDADVVQELLNENLPRKVSLHTPIKGEKKRLIEMACVNAESVFKKEKDADAIRERILLQLQEKLRLNRYPVRIECFDISTISGSETVASMVAFTNGEKDSARYRKYKIKTLETIDDYGAMYEALSRRFKRAQDEGDLPDLLMIDGGKGHLNVALKVFKELNVISVDVIGVAKEEGRHDRGQTMEQIFLPNIKDPILLTRHSPILFLLQKIRDEAHRTAITFHRKKRSEAVLHSVLDDIEGIGPAKKKRLLKHFGSVKKIKNASVDQLADVSGLSSKNAEAIFHFFHQK